MAKAPSSYPAAFEPTDIDPGSHFARTMLAAAEAITGAPQEPWGTPFSSDIGTLVGAGIESVTFGAGNQPLNIPDTQVGS